MELGVITVDKGTVIRPFLKWAGGKRQLLPALRPHFPVSFNRYIAPFLGSGAVFFDLSGAGRLEKCRVELVDLNPDLIGCYRAVRDRTEAVIAALERLDAEHRERGEECYYDVRDARFNPARAARAATTRGSDRAYTPELAAMLIYLNRTGFNGLYRLNRSGAFNVPAGRYVNPRICDADQLRLTAAALRRPGVTLQHKPFDDALRDAGRGDFIYCDPPYAPLSPTARFAQYTAGGFSSLDHRRLQHAIVDAARRGAVVVVSNSSAPEIEAIYTSADARRAGLRVERVAARRAINSRAGSRGPVDELIITNAPAGLHGRTRPTPKMLKVRLTPRKATRAYGS